MNWEDMFGNYVSPSEFRDLREHVGRTMRSTSRRRRELRHRVEDLEADVDFLALLSRTLLQILIIRGDLKKEQFTKLLRRIDLVDGAADGGLDVDFLKDELDPPKPVPKKKAKRVAGAKAKTKKRAKASKKKRR